MIFDINQVLEDMATAASEAASEGSGALADYTREILGNQREALRKLAEARLEGEISDGVLERLLDRELRVAEAEFLTLDMMSRAIKERAWNAARNTFVQAVQSALRAAL